MPSRPAPMRPRMMRPMIRSLLAVLVVASIAVAQAADIGISPARLELSARPGDTVSATVTVLKGSGAEQQVTTEVNDWALDLAGEISYREPGSVDHSASDWLEVDVIDFLLAAGRAEQSVRIDVTVPNDPNLDGTYHTVLFFTVVTPPEDTGPVGVTTTTRVGAITYVTIAGTEQVEVEIADFFDLDERTLSLVLFNGGNTVIRSGGVIELRDEAGDLARSLPLPSVPVMRGSEREILVSLPDDLASGFYVALALVDDGRGDLLVGELLLDVP